jgi:ferric-dicitrate binding protein FerR (iron transport regulator)
LNAASKITLNEKNGKQPRQLVGGLFSGAKKTFSVQTADGVVKVLGTHFNVKRPNYYEVSCYEGLVSVTYNNKTVKLPPGTTFRVVNKQINAVANSTNANPSWTTGI